MRKYFCENELEILNSEEFDSLISAAEQMAETRGNLYKLGKTIEELKCLTEGDRRGLLYGCDTNLAEALANMEDLVKEISVGIYGEN